MADEVININELTQDQHNFNKGTAKGKKLMNKSLKELGAGRSILLDKNGEILYQETIRGSIREAEEMGRKIGKNMLEFL